MTTFEWIVVVELGVIAAAAGADLLRRFIR